MLPTDAQERKNIPIYSGFVCYFPDAIAEVAKVSKRGNDQHNPGTPLHWDRSKSADELDAMMRHVIDSANPDAELDELIDEAAARTWRSLADLQKLCEERVAESKSVVGLIKLAKAAQHFKNTQRLVDCETEQDIVDREQNSKSQKLDEPNYADRRSAAEMLDEYNPGYNRNAFEEPQCES